MNEKLVNEWIVKAEEDYEALEELYTKSPSNFANTICFHAQQCTEKYLKALLTKRGIEPPWIHALETLLDLLVPHIPELEKYKIMLARLTPYATEYRYPGKFATQEDVETCVNIVRQFRNNIKPLLNIKNLTKEAFG